MIRKIIGLTLILSPLLVLLILQFRIMVIESGWLIALKVWGTILAFIGVVFLGFFILSGCAPIKRYGELCRLEGKLEQSAKTMKADLERPKL